MGRAGRVLRVLLVAVIVLGVIWFLLVGILADHAAKTATKAAPSAKIVEHWKMIARERRFLHQDMNFHIVSKRRVPNGPNPIHNRRASQSRQLPGRV